MVAVRDREVVGEGSFGRSGAYGRDAEQSLCGLVHSPRTPPSTGPFMMNSSHVLHREKNNFVYLFHTSCQNVSFEGNCFILIFFLLAGPLRLFTLWLNCRTVQSLEHPDVRIHFLVSLRYKQKKNLALCRNLPFNIIANIC